MPPRRLSRLVICLAALALPACAARSTPGSQTAAAGLRDRTGAEARVDGVASATAPAGVRLDDGLTADEAVAVALWNNAAFQVSVAELGFARADLLEAGVLTNPVLSVLFPVGPKQLEATLRWPIEVLWERPRRVAAARLALDAAAQRLMQAGLDLVASVRIAHADLALASDRAKLAREGATLLARIDTLTQSRLAAGDISALEAATARVDAARAAQDVDWAAHDVAVARQRLIALMGQPLDAPAFELSASAAPVSCGRAADLLREALAARPDVRAAELDIEAAGKRLGWEESRIFTLTAVLDANGQGKEGFEMGPGVDLGIPIFNQNQGPRARATAQLQRAAAAYAALQQQIGLEIRETTTLFEQAQSSLTAWRGDIVSRLQTNVGNAERAYREGEVSYLFVLENTRRLSEARLRERDLVAVAERAHARIERAVGRSCGAAVQGAPLAR
jgi:cobalt-zinc-cadmium efflux system outer membrane protein